MAKATLTMAAAAVAALASGASAQFQLNLLDLTTYPMARCLDGSPGGFYLSASTTGSKTWVIHTQGGGWCISDEDCLGRSRSDLGSSTFWAPGEVSCPSNAKAPPCYADGGAAGMISDNSTINPDLWDANKVFINYCDGGSYAGALEEPVTVTVGNSNSTIYYRGAYILEAIYDQLLSVHGLASATEVIVKGCSAGGLAAYLHLDHLAAKIKGVNPGARVVGAPGAGFFLDIEAYGGGKAYTPNYQWVYQRMNVSAHVNDACVAAHTATNTTWMCFIAPYVLPYISTPLFISNSLADAWQGSNIMRLGCNPNAAGSCNASQIAYLNGFRAAMIAAAQPVLASSVHGAFLQECYVHVVEDVDGSWSRVVVANQTQAQTFAAWWKGAPGSPRVVDGAWGSNPTCGFYSSEAVAW